MKLPFTTKQFLQVFKDYNDTVFPLQIFFYSGALILRNTLPYVPPGVHVAVVDPQVGTERRAVALRTEDGRIFVGPDNGLLSLAWEKAGGVVEAVDVTRSPHRLEPVSATFHGRDVFCPVGAHLARGEELAEAG